MRGDASLDCTRASGRGACARSHPPAEVAEEGGELRGGHAAVPAVQRGTWRTSKVAVCIPSWSSRLRSNTPTPERVTASSRIREAEALEDTLRCLATGRRIELHENLRRHRRLAGGKTVIGRLVRRADAGRRRACHEPDRARRSGRRVARVRSRGTVDGHPVVAGHTQDAADVQRRKELRGPRLTLERGEHGQQRRLRKPGIHRDGNPGTERIGLHARPARGAGRFVCPSACGQRATRLPGGRSSWRSGSKGSSHPTCVGPGWPLVPGSTHRSSAGCARAAAASAASASARAHFGCAARSRARSTPRAPSARGRSRTCCRDPGARRSAPGRARRLRPSTRTGANNFGPCSVHTGAPGSGSRPARWRQVARGVRARPRGRSSSHGPRA